MSAFIELTTIRFDGNAKTSVYLRVDQITQVRTHSVTRGNIHMKDEGSDVVLEDGSVMVIFESPMQVLDLLERADVVDYLPPPPRMGDPF